MDVSFQPQIIRTARGHRDAVAFDVDLGDRFDRRTGGNEIGRLDFDISRGEVDFLRPCRLGADQADIPFVLLGVIGQFAGFRVRHHLHRHAQAGGDGAGHVGGAAVGIARRSAAGDEQEVSHIDCGAQNAMWCELGDDLLLRHVFTSKVC